MQTRSKYIEQLEQLEREIETLACKAADDVCMTARALAGDTEAAEDVLSGSKAAHRLRQTIEEGCLTIMLMQQPLVAEDLRFVSGAFRVVSDLSRIDSKARDVADLSLVIPGEVLGELMVQLEEACAKVTSMVKRAAEAFSSVDVALARQVFAADDEVDILYRQCEQVVVGLIRADGGDAKYLPELLMVAKYYERMADDAERVANWAVFRATGEHEVKSREQDLLV